MSGGMLQGIVHDTQLAAIKRDFQKHEHIL